VEQYSIQGFKHSEFLVMMSTLAKHFGQALQLYTHGVRDILYPDSSNTHEISESIRLMGFCK
jgi:hypothetical protein